jgi:hypothetical protein
MEFTEALLMRIADQLADLRVQLTLFRTVLIQMGAKPEELDRIMNQVRTGPAFQQARALALEQLRGGH